jgi:hypothetical protein
VLPPTRYSGTARTGIALGGVAVVLGLAVTFDVVAASVAPVETDAVP